MQMRDTVASLKSIYGSSDMIHLVKATAVASLYECVPPCSLQISWTLRPCCRLAGLYGLVAD